MVLERRKETHCEFCDARLPDWKGTLTPQCGANAPAVMNVNFDGRTYSFEVKPGPEGYRQFTEAIRRAFNLPDDSELNITFTCDEPTTGSAGAVCGGGRLAPSKPWLCLRVLSLPSCLMAALPHRAPALTAPAPPRLPLPAAVDNGSLLTLQGSGAYDAAVHCASVSAARRLTSPAVSRTVSAAEGAPGAQPSQQPACAACAEWLVKGRRRADWPAPPARSRCRVRKLAARHPHGRQPHGRRGRRIP